MEQSVEINKEAIYKHWVLKSIFILFISEKYRTCILF
jgi:hypothetical protein